MAEAEITATDLSKKYSTATIFTQYPDTHHFLAVPFDAETKGVAEHYGGWKVLSFNHELHGGMMNEIFSSVDLAGDQQHLAAPGSYDWMPQLLPGIYDYDLAKTSPPRKSAGLVGSLPILFALPAFSARPELLSTILTSCLGPNTWIPHKHRHGCKFNHPLY